MDIDVTTDEERVHPEDSEGDVAVSDPGTAPSGWVAPSVSLAAGRRPTATWIPIRNRRSGDGPPSPMGKRAADAVEN